MPDADTLYPQGPEDQLGNRLQNYNAAVKSLNLSDTEKALYKRHLTNLWGPGGVNNPPTAGNPNASRSTLYAMTVDHNGKTYIIPSVYDGKILSEDEAKQRALKDGMDQFPSYDSPEKAKASYDRMHSFMEEDTRQWFASQK
jgi:hypothetical protein